MKRDRVDEQLRQFEFQGNGAAGVGVVHTETFALGRQQAAALSPRSCSRQRYRSRATEYMTLRAKSLEQTAT
jgi:hypothetical protein